MNNSTNFFLFFWLFSIAKMGIRLEKGGIIIFLSFPLSFLFHICFPSPRCLISISSFSTCFLTIVSTETAFGSKRPSFWDLFHERTVFGKASYADFGRVYFSTDERSAKLRRSDGGRVSWTWRMLISWEMGNERLFYI